VDETIKRTVIQKSQANDVGQETASIKDEPANAVRQNSFTVSAASMLLLEKSLKKKFNDQEEARRREKTIRSKSVSLLLCAMHTNF
jgi:predicted house-cleaning NTP pyrophosphatase (Maf/HAM1 superfamily)